MESTAFVQDRDVVVPGMVLAQGMEYLPSKGTYRKDDQIIANRLGLVQFDGKVIKTIPLAGRYLPKKDDIIVGKVIDVLLTGWRIEMNSPYEAVLTLKEASSDFIQRGADLTRYFALNDWVVCQVVQVTSQNLIDVSVRGPGLRKLIGGTIINVSAAKVPRIIGKRGSMVSMIKKATDCNVIVGQNGRVWLNGSPEMERVALQAIAMIEKYAHTSGLTERVQRFLHEQTGRHVDATPDEESTQFGGESGQTERRERRSFGSDRPLRQGFRREGFRRGGFRKESSPDTNQDTSTGSDQSSDESGEYASDSEQ